MSDRSIRTKLFFGVLALAVPVLALVGGLAYLQGKAAVERTTFEHLTSVRASKATQIERYYEQIRSLTRSFAKNHMVSEAMMEFDAAHDELAEVEVVEEHQRRVVKYYRDVFLPRLAAHSSGRIEAADFLPTDPAELHLQYHYIAANPNPPGEKDLLDDAGDGTPYSAVHRLYQPALRDFVHEFGFHDLFLIDGSGNVVFTVAKEVDLGTNLIDGPYKSSNLAAAYHAAQEDVLSDTVALVDFESYAPSEGEPASFMAAPILDGVWLLGVLVVQMPVSKLDAVMTNDGDWQVDALGSTGETFLVGPDFLMRSNSRFVLEDPDGYVATALKSGMSESDARAVRQFGTTILIQEARTPEIEAALAGESATKIATSYRGIEALMSYARLDVEGVDWAIISKIDAMEAFARIRLFTRNLVIGLASLMALVLVAAWVLSRRFVEPIIGLDHAARRFAGGESDVEVPVEGDDELGRLAGSFNQMVSAIRQQTADLKRTAEELEGVSSVILRWAPDGTIQFVNDYGLELFGWDSEGLVGRPLAGTIVPASEEVEESIRTMAANIAANPAKFEIDETENQTRDGRRIWMAWRNTPILDDSGRLSEILTIGIDITERREQERQIEQQKALLENTLESLTHPFYVIDTATYEIKIANSAARALGHSGMTTCHALSHKRDTPCDGADHQCPMIEVKKTKKPYIVEHIHEDAEGNPRIMEVNGYPIFDDNGNVIQMIEYSVDITERKEAEERVRQSEERIRSMVENMPGVVYRCLPVDPWTMFFISDEIKNLSGYPASDFLGDTPVRSFASIMHEADRERIAENTSKALEARQPYTNEYRVIDRNGQVRWVIAKGKAIYDDDQPVYLDGTIFDVTDKKLMELELSDAKDAAESANRAKSTFLANMSHELRTPMNAIIGYSEMLAEDAEDEELDHMVPDLEKINAAGKHLLALINDILDLSKIEAGRMDLFLERFDLQQVLGEAVATVTPLVAKNSNELVTDFAEDLGTVRLDLTKFRQALFNLLSNAAKFTTEGQVTIRARRVERENQPWVVLDVSDEGIGIHEDKLEAVFEEFSQADDSTTRDYGGTGLGLPISRRFCRMMGGDITVQSVLGQGSTFTIELPAEVDALDAAKKASREATDQAVEIAGDGRPVLVVDDDPDSRELLQRLLEGEGFTVVVASSGEEGLDLARQYNPTLMTLDVMMPGMDGWAVLQAMKADPELAHIPVMMVSIAGDKDLGYTLGAVECLSKPVDRDQLRQLVTQYAQPSGGGRALVVDDDEGIRSLFRRSLEGDGWTVDEAENGAVALEVAAAHAHDLILLDLMMPVMDGFEFVLNYRQRDGCHDTPIIVVTAKDLDQHDRDLLNGGVERVVQKGGMTRSELVKQVRQLVVDRAERGALADSSDLE